MKITVSNDATHREVLAHGMFEDVMYRNLESGDIWIRTSPNTWLRAVEAGLVTVTNPSTIATFERLPKGAKVVLEQTL